MTVKDVYLDISYANDDIKSSLNLTEEIFGTILSKVIRDPVLIRKSKLVTFNREIDVNVSIYISNDAEIKILNKEYRNIDKSTDVLGFALFQEGETPVCAGGGIVELGDIVISFETAEKQAEEKGHSVLDEVIFLYTHGLLHLLGYDHENEEDYKEMLDAQTLLLEGILTNPIS